MLTEDELHDWKEGMTALHKEAAGVCSAYFIRDFYELTSPINRERYYARVARALLLEDVDSLNRVSFFEKTQVFVIQR